MDGSDDDEPFEEVSFPDDCQDETDGIRCLSKFLMGRFYGSPYFHCDTLHSACQEAFASPTIDDRRPVLIYVHNNDSIYTNIFCSKIFCSELFIEYLLGNYLVWPWDITKESNRERLTHMWNEKFPGQTLTSSFLNQCPLLIGVMRFAAGEDRWSSLSEYEWKPLLLCDKLSRTGEQASRQALMQDLRAFRNECLAREKIPIFDLAAVAGLSCEVALEISQYLSLNDAVNVFSDGILATLRRYKSRVHLSHSSQAFLDVVLRMLLPEQIVSLRLNTVSNWPERYLRMFTNLRSLTLFNFSDHHQIKAYLDNIPKLLCLSLRYDSTLALYDIGNIIARLQTPIRRLEIHSVGAYCGHYEHCRSCSSLPNAHVHSLLIEVRHMFLPTINQCCRQLSFCFPATLLDYLSTLPNLRQLQLRVDEHNLGQFLNWPQWTSLIQTCAQLKKITVETCTYVSGIDCVQKAMEIDTAPYRSGGPVQP